MFFTQSVKLGRLNFQKRQGARKDLLETTEWANISRWHNKLFKVTQGEIQAYQKSQVGTQAQ
jgi:hypothetical protein